MVTADGAVRKSRAGMIAINAAGITAGDQAVFQATGIVGRVIEINPMPKVVDSIWSELDAIALGSKGVQQPVDVEGAVFHEADFHARLDI